MTIQFSEVGFYLVLFYYFILVIFIAYFGITRSMLFINALEDKCFAN